jgi:hypothetical protein
MNDIPEFNLTLLNGVLNLKLFALFFTSSETEQNDIILKWVHKENSKCGEAKQKLQLAGLSRNLYSEGISFETRKRRWLLKEFYAFLQFSRCFYRFSDASVV